MSNTNTFVGSKIKGLRETKNLSIEEVAESTGLSVEERPEPALTGPADQDSQSTGCETGNIHGR